MSQYLLSDMTRRPLKTATSCVNDLTSRLCVVADIVTDNNVMIQAMAKILIEQGPKPELNSTETELDEVHAYEEIECLPLLPPQVVRSDIGIAAVFHSLPLVTFYKY